MNNTLYDSDLTDVEWSFLEPLVPLPKPGGRPASWTRRAILDGIFYLLRSGCTWRMMPHEYPPWQTLYRYFRAWQQSDVWENINTRLREYLRMASGRKSSPSGAIIDSQSSKTTECGGTRGYDGGKKINGRKRHILVDTNGFVLKVKVHAANVQDRAGAKLLLEPLVAQRQRDALCSRLRVVWADRGYTGPLNQWMQEHLGLQLRIVSYRTQQSVEDEFWNSVKQRRQAGVEGADLYVGLSLTRSVNNKMQVAPRRWVVERTFAWLGRNRRLSKDYETLPCSSEAFVYLAMIRLMLKRLDKVQPTQSQFCASAKYAEVR